MQMASEILLLKLQFSTDVKSKSLIAFKGSFYYLLRKKPIKTKTSPLADDIEPKLHGLCH
jgi:hypothetical protein